MRDSAIVAVATGMREAEVFGLSVAQVSIARRSVHLEKTKSDYPRSVPLNDDAVEILQSRIQSKAANNLGSREGTAKRHIS